MSKDASGDISLFELKVNDYKGSHNRKKRVKLLKDNTKQFRHEGLITVNYTLKNITTFS